MVEHASDNLVSLGARRIAQAAAQPADVGDFWAERHRVMAGPAPLVARADGTVEAIRVSQSVTRSLGRLAETIASIP